MSAIQDVISDVEAMRSSMGVGWFGPFSNEVDGHIEWPNLAISIQKLKSEPSRLDAAAIVDRLCPIIIASNPGFKVGPKLAHELAIRLNDLLQNEISVVEGPTP